MLFLLGRSYIPLLNIALFVKGRYNRINNYT